MLARNRAIGMNADDVLRGEASFVIALWRDPDVAVAIEHGDVSAGCRGQPAVIHAAHDRGDLFRRRLTEKLHIVRFSLSVMFELYLVQLYHAPFVLSFIPVLFARNHAQESIDSFAGKACKAALEVLTFCLPNAIINNAVWV